jgi:hypothetical protein
MPRALLSTGELAHRSVPSLGPHHKHGLGVAQLSTGDLAATLELAEDRLAIEFGR